MIRSPSKKIELFPVYAFFGYNINLNKAQTRVKFGLHARGMSFNELCARFARNLQMHVKIRCAVGMRNLRYFAGSRQATKKSLQPHFRWFRGVLGASPRTRSTLPRLYWPRTSSHSVVVVGNRRQQQHGIAMHTASFPTMPATTIGMVVAPR